MPACHAGGHEFESRTHRTSPSLFRGGLAVYSPPEQEGSGVVCARLCRLLPTGRKNCLKLTSAVNLRTLSQHFQCTGNPSVDSNRGVPRSMPCFFTKPSNTFYMAFEKVLEGFVARNAQCKCIRCDVQQAIVSFFEFFLSFLSPKHKGYVTDNETVKVPK